MEILFKKLKAGGVIFHPTETCYGFAADSFNEEAVRKVYEIKRMGFDKPVSILCSDLEMAREYGVFSELALDLARRFWPGPLSIVVPRTDKVPDFLNKKEDFISMRVPGDELCRQMVAGLGRPVITTSANRTGERQLYEVDLSQFEEDKGLIDHVVDGGIIPENLPSTLVKIVGEEMVILREGEIKASVLFKKDIQQN